MLDQVEERRLGPVDVLDEKHERLLPSASLEGLADLPEDFLGRALAKRSLELLLGVGRGEDLAQRPIRNPFAVRETAPDEDGCLAAQRARDLACQSGLADPGRSEHGDKAASSFRHCRFECSTHSRELLSASDQRSIEPPVESRRVFNDPQEPVGRKRLRFPLQLERLDRLDLDCIPREPHCRLTDKNVARLRRLLEPGRDVDGVARRQALLGAGDNFARVDAGT